MELETYSATESAATFVHCSRTGRQTCTVHFHVMMHILWYQFRVSLNSTPVVAVSDFSHVDRLPWSVSILPPSHPSPLIIHPHHPTV
jgi:hypothetical protein